MLRVHRLIFKSLDRGTITEIVIIYSPGGVVILGSYYNRKNVEICNIELF